MSNTLATIQSLARQAGEILLEGYGHTKKIEYKGEIDLVTEYDRRSEAIILAKLREHFPDHAILAEESGQNNISSEYKWIIDPLDGTTNFAHGYPFFAISIVLTLNDKPIIGVVYDPLRGELFSAEAGKGATLNNTPIHVSSQADLGQALLSTGFPYDVRTNPRNNFKQFIQFHLRVQGIRRAGATALDCVWVAAGRVDGFWEFGIKPWDVAAGILIAREAGGCATTADGNENFLSDNSIVVSNSHLHESMLAILRESENLP